MMRHEINHRFHSTFEVASYCQICDKQVFLGFKCKDCKYICHRNCAHKAKPYCGLPVPEDQYEEESLKPTGTRQNSVTAQEWDIPQEELTEFPTDRINNSEFVLKGYWHGDVTIKCFKIPPKIRQNAKEIKHLKELFKEEVANFRNTRHDNLEYFMGTCINLPAELSIITTYCRGETLYEHLHINKTKFTIERIISIAQQICSGMSYLHSRHIVHKDLKTKNIFYDNGQIIITDFGMFTLKQICRPEPDKPATGDWLSVPKGWLPYLDPEIIRRLSPYETKCNLPFSYESDIYAFGTIWYELLIREMPYKFTRPEIIIWQVGRGIKQPLINLTAPREVKDVLLMCWSTDAIGFTNVTDLLCTIPFKKISRSSSFRSGHGEAAT